MAISVRFYIFEESGAIKRVPQRLGDDLTFGRDGLAEYAGSRQKVAQILVRNEGGRPARIVDAKGCYWTFDAEGRIDRGLQQTLANAMEFAFDGPVDRKAQVVDLQPELKRKRFNEEHRWEVMFEDLKRLAVDLWPDSANEPKIKTVKGKAPAKPPRTRRERRIPSK